MGNPIPTPPNLHKSSIFRTAPNCPSIFYNFTMFKFLIIIRIGSFTRQNLCRIARGAYALWARRGDLRLSGSSPNWGVSLFASLSRPNNWSMVNCPESNRLFAIIFMVREMVGEVFWYNGNYPDIPWYTLLDEAAHRSFHR